MHKLKNLLYIYKKSKKRIQLIYFLKYKKQIALLKSKQYKNKSFISVNNNSNYNNYNACNRLYNGLKIKQANIDKLSQRFLQDEAEKYPFFPEINRYDLIYKNYYVVNNIPLFENKSNNKRRVKTEIPNPNNKYMHYKNAYYDKINDEEGNNHYFTSNDIYNNIYDENINLNKINNNNYINKNNGYYDSMIKKKMPLLDELIKEEKKIENSTTSKIMDYKNKIPNNFKKIFKKKTGKSTKINKNIPKKFYKKKSEENHTIYNLTDYYPSPVTQKDLNINSDHNLLLNEENSNYFHSTKNNSFNNKNNIVLSPNNNINNRYHNSPKSGLPLEIVRDYNNKDKKKSNSYNFLPNNECFVSLEAKKNKTNLNSKRNNKNIIDYKIGKNGISYVSSNIALNSIGFIDNSLSTNFIDKQSIYDNHTISVNNNNNIQTSVIYNKNKNISHTFPTKYNKDNKENNINLSGENYNNKIYFKKINNYKRSGKKKKKKVFNRIAIENKRDNFTSNTIKTDSSSKNPKIKSGDDLKEKSDYYIIENDLFDREKNLQLKIASEEVNENVNIKSNKQDKMLPSSEKSEPITIQSLSDSKILEIANYYLNEEETVDKIEISDLLFTKNNKSNINIKEK